mgnify:CR=1 FL=1
MLGGSCSRASDSAVLMTAAAPAAMTMWPTLLLSEPTRQKPVSAVLTCELFVKPLIEKKLAALMPSRSRVKATLDNLAQARTAIRAKLARPATLALVAGTSGLLCFWVARRRVSLPSTGRARAANPVAGLALTFLVQIAIRHLPLIFEHVSAARKKRAAQFATQIGPYDSPGGQPL